MIRLRDSGHSTEPFDDWGAPAHSELGDTIRIDGPIFGFGHCRDVVAAVTNTGGVPLCGDRYVGYANSR